MNSEQKQGYNDLTEMDLTLEEAQADWEQAKIDAENLAALESSQTSKIPLATIKTELANECTIEGETYISSARLGERLNEQGFNLKSFRHLGDLLGNGPNGLKLESQKGKNGKNNSKRFYKIPEPTEYGDWYDDKVPCLPKSYYSETAYRLLVAKMYLKKKKQASKEK